MTDRVEKEPLTTVVGKLHPHHPLTSTPETGRPSLIHASLISQLILVLEWALDALGPIKLVPRDQTVLVHVEPLEHRFDGAIDLGPVLRLKVVRHVHRAEVAVRIRVDDREDVGTAVAVEKEDDDVDRVIENFACRAKKIRSPPSSGRRERRRCAG